MPEVSLAGRRFRSVPTMLSDAGNDDDPTQMANVGIQFLKQFRVDLDLGHDHVYLTPRSDAPGFDRDRSGARFDLDGDKLKAVFVSPHGPAADAGLKGMPLIRDHLDLVNTRLRGSGNPDWIRKADRADRAVAELDAALRALRAKD